MRFKQFMAAATDWRTLVILGAGVVAAAVLSNPFPAVIALGIYLWAAQRLSASGQYQAAAEQLQVKAGLEAKYKAMQDAVAELCKVLPQKPGEWNRRSAQVQHLARSIYHEWLSHAAERQDQVPAVGEALHLAGLYMKILRAHLALNSRPNLTTPADVRNRLARNQMRLEQTQDLEARRTLLEAIELDQRVLEREADEEVERERFEAKLAAIESTMEMYQRNILDPGATPEGSRLHEMLLEAEAMDQAMDEVQQRSRARAQA
ncbi:MAG TPA: hypothetical protein VD973_04550 [Symbiobacteriaceae bacterium]|nr:hypothetical protein [Symbiobacteriaceae bacterium]